MDKTKIDGKVEDNNTTTFIGWYLNKPIIGLSVHKCEFYTDDRKFNKENQCIYIDPPPELLEGSEDIKPVGLTEVSRKIGNFVQIPYNYRICLYRDTNGQMVVSSHAVSLGFDRDFYVNKARQLNSKKT